jgi:chemotaxis protein histidine kinase CheA
VDAQIAELIPLFLRECRGRLGRLVELVPRVGTEAAAEAEARRELHTLRGSCRLLELAELAELCLAGENLLDTAPADLAPRLEQILDRLSCLLEEAAEGWGESARKLEHG